MASNGQGQFGASNAKKLRLCPEEARSLRALFTVGWGLDQGHLYKEHVLCARGCEVRSCSPARSTLSYPSNTWGS